MVAKAEACDTYFHQILTLQINQFSTGLIALKLIFGLLDPFKEYIRMRLVRTRMKVQERRMINSIRIMVNNGQKTNQDLF